ncbi:hypothetical protein I79_008593 [Cricetulus griseus]|uniref:Uncharacterized protein n=1 Tax=Cricetulus griseus TaxID=10029 RepID=G3HDL0_CRIGR|nr:hypothetical protein I79_008593 [Cricetulus griseus]
MRTHLCESVGNILQPEQDSQTENLFLNAYVSKEFSSTLLKILCSFSPASSTYTSMSASLPDLPIPSRT